MTRKDYKKFAELIKDYKADRGESILLSALVADLGYIFKQDNDRFDYDKFFKACGLAPDKQ